MLGVATPGPSQLLISPSPTSIAGEGRGAVRRWDPLLIALAIYLLAAVGRVHQLFPILLPLKPLFLSSAAAIALLYLLPGDRRGRDLAPMFHSPPIRWMCLLLGWAVLSVPGALWVGGAFEMVTDVLVKAVLMAAIVTGAVRSLDDVVRLAGIYFAGIALYSAVVLLRFDVGGGAWRLNDLYYYDANDFATIAVTALPIGLFFAARGAAPWIRWGSLAGLAAITGAFAWAGSRGGFVAVLAVGAYIVVRTTTLPLRWRLAGAGLATVVLLLGANDTFWAKMGTLLSPGEDYNLESHEGRKAIWTRGFGYMATHPVLGVGAGNFPTAEGTISPRATRQAVGRGVKWQAAHNSFVQIGAELGVPGLCFFLAMIVSAVRGLAPRPAFATLPPPDPRRGPLAQALTASILGFVVGGFFLSLAYAEALYVLVAFSAGLRRVAPW